jgi:hypothetical protein
MNVNEKRIDCITEYIDIIMSYFSKLKPNDFFEKEKVFFRGQSKDFPLIPSIARSIRKDSKRSDLDRPKHQDNFIRFEAEMVQSAKLQEPEEFANVIYPVNMLAKMQHYGLPTRLLDITENALVALFFACNKDFAHEGRVYCFKVEQKNIRSAYSMYANLAAFLYTQPYSIININDLYQYCQI